MFDPRFTGRSLVAALSLSALVACAAPSNPRPAFVSDPDVLTASPLANGNAPARARVAAQDVDDSHSTWAPVAGRGALGFSTGWAFYEAEVELKDVGGELGFEEGTDSTTLEPIIGGAIKASHFFNEHFSLGGVYEFRQFDGTATKPLSATIEPDPYVSSHFILTARAFTSPLESMPRLKLFAGLDLTYVPGISLDATVQYSPSFQERTTLSGDEFFTLAPVVGGSWWIGDMLGHDASLDFGAFYEFALDPSSATVTLNIPDGLGGTVPNDVDGDVYPEGLIFFVGTTFYF